MALSSVQGIHLFSLLTSLRLLLQETLGPGTGVECVPDTGQGSVQGSQTPVSQPCAQRGGRCASPWLREWNLYPSHPDALAPWEPLQSRVCTWRQTCHTDRLSRVPRRFLCRSNSSLNNTRAARPGRQASRLQEKGLEAQSRSRPCQSPQSMEPNPSPGADGQQTAPQCCWVPGQPLPVGQTHVAPTGVPGQHSPEQRLKVGQLSAGTQSPVPEAVASAPWTWPLPTPASAGPRAP